MKKEFDIDKAVDAYFSEINCSKRENTISELKMQNSEDKKMQNVFKSLDYSRSKYYKKEALDSDFENVIKNSTPKKRKNKNIIYYRIAVVILLAIITSMGSMLFRSEKDLVYKTHNSQVSTLWLKDSTKVILAQNSELRVPEGFDIDNRRVEFSGEALFNVTKSKTSKFQLNSGKFGLTVLGTKFKLKTNKNQKEISVLLEEGKVALDFSKYTEGDSQQYIIESGELFVFNKINNKIRRVKVPNRVKFDLEANKLEFTKVKFIDFVKSLNMIYKNNIRLKTNRINNIEINATFENKSVLEILDNIKKLLNYKIVKEDGKLTITI
jgi:ferric-dicitrate binding protein FerR (iron transport regulator)